MKLGIRFGAIARPNLRGVLPDSMADKLRRKLMKQITAVAEGRQP